MRLLPRSLGLAIFLAAAPFVTAQVTFTITATADNSFVGYTGGSSYSFVFTTTSIGTENPSDSTSGTSSSWYDVHQTNDNRIWSTVSGSFNGTFSYANLAFNNSSEVGAIQTTYSAPSSVLSLFVGSVPDAVGDIGLKTLNNTAIGEVWVVVSSNNGSLPSFNQPATWTNLTTYFSTYNGTYSPNSTVQLHLVDAIQNSHADLLTFTVNSVQISTVVPEPATQAILLATGALGLALLRRRRLAA